MHVSLSSDMGTLGLRIEETIVCLVLGRHKRQGSLVPCIVREQWNRLRVCVRREVGEQALFSSVQVAVVPFFELLVYFYRANCGWDTLRGYDCWLSEAHRPPGGVGCLPFARPCRTLYADKRCVTWTKVLDSFLRQRIIVP